jgi:hypothetical protein
MRPTIKVAMGRVTTQVAMSQRLVALRWLHLRTSADPLLFVMRTGLVTHH